MRAGEWSDRSARAARSGTAAPSAHAVLPAEAPARPGFLPPRGRPRSRVLRCALSAARAVAVPALLVALWTLASSTGWLSGALLPAPWEVAEALVAFFAGSSTVTLPGLTPFEGAGWVNVAASLRRLLVAYGIAVAVGVPAGLALGLSRTAAVLLDPLVQGLRAIPIFAWLPLSVVWFGLGEGAARYLVFIGAVFPIVVATADAVARVPRAWVETALMLGAPRRDLARKVYLPGALPGIVTGLRLGLSLGWMSVIVGELTGLRTGVGAMMTSARESGRLDQVVVGMVCFAVLGLLGDLLLRLGSRRATAWARR